MQAVPFSGKAMMRANHDPQVGKDSMQLLKLQSTTPVLVILQANNFVNHVSALVRQRSC